MGPRPRIESPGDASGLGCTRRIGVGSWGGVRERITAADPPRRLAYRVTNPSWTTYPVDHHVAEVVFIAAAGGATDVRWRIDLVPKRGAGFLVEMATRLVIGRYLDALSRACESAGQDGRSSSPWAP